MSLPVGKSALQLLFNWTPRLSWYKELRKIRTRIADAYLHRSEITGGGIVTEGASIASGTFSADFTGLSCVLKAG